MQTTTARPRIRPRIVARSVRPRRRLAHRLCLNGRANLLYLKGSVRMRGRFHQVPIGGRVAQSDHPFRTRLRDGKGHDRMDRSTSAPRPEALHETQAKAIPPKGKGGLVPIQFWATQAEPKASPLGFGLLFLKQGPPVVREMARNGPTELSHSETLSRGLSNRLRDDFTAERLIGIK